MRMSPILSHSFRLERLSRDSFLRALPDMKLRLTGKTISCARRVYEHSGVCICAGCFGHAARGAERAC